jgi:hypothetical protein
MQYRKKPVVIEAFQFDPSDGKAWPKWFQLAVAERIAIFAPIGEAPAILIHTLEGEHRADVKDWIIKGVKGELYPCKPDIFVMTYEPVEEAISSPAART